MTSYASPILSRKLIRTVGRTPQILRTGKEYRIGDLGHPDVDGDVADEPGLGLALQTWRTLDRPHR